MKLRSQLFFTLLFASAVLIALMFAVSNWSFNRGFLEYLNSVQLQRLDDLADSLTDYHDEHNNFDALANDPRMWRQQLDAGVGERSGRAGKPPPKRDRKGNGGRPRPSQPIVLANNNKQPLIGPKKLPNDMLWRPIVTDTGTVGYLGILPRNQLTDEVDKVFSSQQQKSFATAAIIMVFACALLAILLSSRLIRPLLDIQRAVTQISGGAFSHRVEAQRQDELGDLARDINQLAMTLEKNLKARQQWLAEISHELRTPVAVLQSEIEAIQDGVTSANDQSIASLHNETLRLSRLIQDLHELTLSDAGSLSYQMQNLDLVALIKERLQANQLSLQSAELAFSLDASPQKLFMNGDRDRLSQLIDNLLQNSLRYTDKPGQLQITLRHQDSQLIFIWEDTFPGVTDEQLPQLFDPLYRTEESRNRAHGGAGLGLSIVQKIIMAHQGTIEARSSELGGLCINMQLPINHRQSS